MAVELQSVLDSGDLLSILLNAGYTPVKDSEVETVKGVDVKISNAIVGGLTFQGEYNAATNTPDLETSTGGVFKGAMYVVSTSGLFHSRSVVKGDYIYSLVSNPISESQWVVLNSEYGLVDEFTRELISTSYTSGLEVTANVDPTKFDYTAGKGVIVDHSTTPPVITKLDIPAATGILITSMAGGASTELGFDVNGNLLQQQSYTPTERRSIFTFSVLAHPQGVLDSIAPAARVRSKDLPNTMTDLAEAIGGINLDGNVVGAAGVDLKVNITSGTVFRIGSDSGDLLKPNHITSDSISPITFLYTWGDGAGGFNLSQTSDINPTKYDDSTGGVGQPNGSVSTNSWTKMRVYYAPRHAGEVGIIAIQYGNTVYNTSDEALIGTAEDLGTNPVLDKLLRRADIVVRGGATNLSLVTDCIFVSANKFGSQSGGSGGITDHELMNNLLGGLAGDHQHLTTAQVAEVNDVTNKADRTLSNLTNTTASRANLDVYAKAEVNTKAEVDNKINTNTSMLVNTEWVGRSAYTKDTSTSARYATVGGGGLEVNAATGAIKIVLPVNALSGDKVSFVLSINGDGYESLLNFTAVLDAVSSWNDCLVTTMTTSSTEYTVRCKVEGGKPVVLIGEVNTVWTNLMVGVFNVQAITNTPANYASSWLVSIDSAAFANIVVTKNNTLVHARDSDLLGGVPPSSYLYTPESGSVVQTVSKLITEQTSQTITTTDTLIGTQFFLDITPKFSNSLFKVEVRYFGEMVNAQDVVFNIQRDGIRINSSGVTNRDCISMATQTYGGAIDNSSTPELLHITTVDKTGSTAGVPTQFKLVATSSTNLTLWLNRCFAIAYERGTSEIIITEILA